MWRTLHNSTRPPKKTCVNRKSFLLCLAQPWLTATPALRDGSWATCLKCVPEEEMARSEIAPEFLGAIGPCRAGNVCSSTWQPFRVTSVTWVIPGKDRGVLLTWRPCQTLMIVHVCLPYLFPGFASNLSSAASWLVPVDFLTSSETCW